MRRPVEPGLAATVGVVEQPCGRQAASDGHLKGGSYQVRAQRGVEGTSHEAAGEQVEHDGHGEPAFSGPDVDDVGDPGVVRIRDLKLPVRTFSATA